MANWVGTGRTNYVKVKDVSQFKRALAPFDTEILEKDGMYGFTGNSEGGIPTRCLGDMDEDWLQEFGALVTDPDDDEWEDFCATPLDFIHHLMKSGEVLIWLEVGAEKLRYLTGYAQAIHSDGRELTLNLNDIYEMVSEKWDLPPDEISTATY